jgi:hypothetical protein
MKIVALTSSSVEECSGNSGYALCKKRVNLILVKVPGWDIDLFKKFHPHVCYNQGDFSLRLSQPIDWFCFSSTLTRALEPNYLMPASHGRGGLSDEVL